MALTRFTYVNRFLAGLFIINFLTTATLFVFILVTSQFFMSKRSMQYLNNIIGWIMCQQAAFVAYYICNIKMVTYGDEGELLRIKQGNYIYNMNHRYELDPISAWYIGSAYNYSWGGKACVKEEIRGMPILGKIWELADFIFVQRGDWSIDKDYIDKTTVALNDYVSNYIILIFCEGGLYTESRFKRGNDFARQKGLQELKYHMLPRTRGFVHIVKSLRPTLTGVYDITCRCVGDAKPTLMNMISGAEITSHCHYRRFEMSEVPGDDGGVEKWLYKLYEEKDKLVDGFVKTGSFPGKAVSKKVPLYTAAVSLAFLCLYTLPLYYFTISSVASCLPTTALFFGGIVLSATFVWAWYKIVDISSAPESL